MRKGVVTSDELSTYETVRPPWGNQTATGEIYGLFPPGHPRSASSALSSLGTRVPLGSASATIDQVSKLWHGRTPVASNPKSQALTEHSGLVVQSALGRAEKGRLMRIRRPALPLNLPETLDPCPESSSTNSDACEACGARRAIGTERSNRQSGREVFSALYRGIVGDDRKTDQGDPVGKVNVATRLVGHIALNLRDDGTT